MPGPDTTLLGQEILQPRDFEPLRRYFRQARAGIERIYEDASEDEKQRHFKILAKELVARGVRQIEGQLEAEDRSLLETMLPDLERIVHRVFQEEFDLADDDADTEPLRPV